MNKPIDYESKPFKEHHLIPLPSNERGGIELIVEGMVAGWPDGMKTRQITNIIVLDIDGEKLFEYSALEGKTDV